MPFKKFVSAEDATLSSLGESICRRHIATVSPWCKQVCAKLKWDMTEAVRVMPAVIDHWSRSSVTHVKYKV
jgi:hypothetical protein